MEKCYIPQGYRNPLNVYETQRAIEFIKKNFQNNLSHALNLSGSQRRCSFRNPPV